MLCPPGPGDWGARAHLCAQGMSGASLLLPRLIPNLSARAPAISSIARPPFLTPLRHRGFHQPLIPLISLAGREFFDFYYSHFLLLLL